MIDESRKWTIFKVAGLAFPGSTIFSILWLSSLHLSNLGSAVIVDTTPGFVEALHTGFSLLSPGLGLTEVLLHLDLVLLPSSQLAYWTSESIFIFTDCQSLLIMILTGPLFLGGMLNRVQWKDTELTEVSE